MPVVAVTGMRQTGKTTMLLRDPLMQDRLYISLDDIALLKAARDDASGLWGEEDSIIIDEAQRVPELLLAVKRSVDLDRRSGRFILSGSASFDLKKGLAESLAGRAIYLSMHSLTRREISSNISNPPFLLCFMKEQRLPRVEAKPITDGEVLLGGLPPVVLNPDGVETWFKGFEQNYLERDIRLIARITNTIGFRDLLRLAAMRTGTVLNVSSLARDAGLPVETAKRYLGWIEESFVIRRLPPFLRNRATRIRKDHKLTVVDSGLASFLAGISDLRETPLRGALYETYVAQNLLGILAAHDYSAELLYWRTNTGQEVDFVIDRKTDLLAIEVKAASSWSVGDLRGLRAFLEATPDCTAAILAYNGHRAVKIGDRLWAIPIATLLS